MGACDNVRAICPYYGSHRTNKIQCKGIEETTGLYLAFADAETRAKWQGRYCYRFSYCVCPIAQAIAVSREATIKLYREEADDDKGN